MKWGFGERELCGFIDSFSQREPRFTAAAPRFNGAAYWNPSANGSDTGKRRALNVGQQQHVWSQPTAGGCGDENGTTILRLDTAQANRWSLMQ